MGARMSAGAVAWALQRRIPRAPTKLLLVSLAMRADQAGNVRIDHQIGKALAIECGLRLKNVPERVVELQQAGYVIEADHGLRVLFGGRSA